MACEGDVGCEPPGAAEALRDVSFSARRFSKVPRSVRPLSSSLSNPVSVRAELICTEIIKTAVTSANVWNYPGYPPDSLKRFSILPKRFSRPSMYLALDSLLAMSNLMIRRP